MSDVEAAQATFVPSGRPMVRFVAAIVAVAVACGVVWWSALFNPRVEVVVESWQTTPVGVAVLAVHNQGPTIAHVQVRGLLEPLVQMTQRSRQVLVAAHATAHLTVRYRVDCAGYARAIQTRAGATAPTLRLVVHATGRLGGGRSFVPADGDTVDLGKACPAG